MTISGCNAGHYLIGDPTFPMQNWLMKLFFWHCRLTPKQHMYNYNNCCRNGFWDIKRTTEVPPKKKWLQAGAEQECYWPAVYFTIFVRNMEITSLRSSQADINNQPCVQPLPEHGNAEGTDIRAVLTEYLTPSVHLGSLQTPEVYNLSYFFIWKLDFQSLQVVVTNIAAITYTKTYLIPTRLVVYIS